MKERFHDDFNVVNPMLLRPIVFDGLVLLLGFERLVVTLVLILVSWATLFSP